MPCAAAMRAVGAARPFVASRPQGRQQRRQQRAQMKVSVLEEPSTSHAAAGIDEESDREQLYQRFEELLNEYNVNHRIGDKVCGQHGHGSLNAGRQHSHTHLPLLAHRSSCPALSGCGHGVQGGPEGSICGCGRQVYGLLPHGRAEHGQHQPGAPAGRCAAARWAVALLLAPQFGL